MTSPAGLQGQVLSWLYATYSCCRYQIASRIETVDSLPVSFKLEPNTLTVTAHRQKLHFCSAESGSKDRVMCIGHWPVTRPDPAQNVDPATRWPVTRTTRFHLCYKLFLHLPIHFYLGLNNVTNLQQLTVSKMSPLYVGTFIEFVIIVLQYGFRKLRVTTWLTVFK